jgi:hypothetical protein
MTSHSTEPMHNISGLCVIWVCGKLIYERQVLLRIRAQQASLFAV